MSQAQMAQYDLFLDENDWDIYYWATQDPPAPGDSDSKETETDTLLQSPRAGEWAQTVGTFKPAYRPVPARWKDSEILKMLREHVASRRAGEATGEGDKTPKGMAFMPPLFDVDEANKKA
jgi:Flavinator of succinate dehydrogenase